MRLYIVLLSMIFSLATAETQYLRLWNGQSWANSTYHEPLSEPVHSRSLAPRDGKAPCNGSFKCKVDYLSFIRGGGIDFMCREAEDMIDDETEYFTGAEKEKTGVCGKVTDFGGDGCGIFIKKKKGHPKDSECKIMGRDMRMKVFEIRSRNCKICGRLPVDGDDKCEVVIDYVTQCKNPRGGRRLIPPAKS
ncbi:MAG: hypothetical protein Q9214_006320 [Letrouitia sp. 1 TL-2023]